ncbi:hypothetical protein EDB92DRAFT_1853030 [Lactarius akahatsu]|uniref:Uncharacterized protein n=1 Tax=Lactarius akahatsu TaxID=416441 RepID=A0AAD4LHT8_9AGAM|nr:hypothetical protein EDB92DRAFT_1853030 [Lactarius akahatsu]
MCSINLLAILLMLTFSAAVSPTMNQDKREPAGGGPLVVFPPSIIVLTSCFCFRPLLSNFPIQLLTQAPMLIGNNHHRCEWLQKFREPERQMSSCHRRAKAMLDWKRTPCDHRNVIFTYMVSCLSPPVMSVMLGLGLYQFVGCGSGTYR